ncbi:MAG: RagB/SusD family nutrient uptake outer membrane protein [Pseudobacter sp.]|uniref:RagB/SusD family nutrient uptake outer membrane protein n=1 Tax=Pseudobacter sp. TaxID=2045420 RepID=UPI003F7E30E6
MRYIKHFLFILTAFTVLSGCKKEYLEINPKGQLIAVDVRDYDLMMNVTTMNFLDYTYSQIYMGDEIIGQEPYFTGQTSVTTARMFKYADQFYDPEMNDNETPALLRQLYVYNKIITEVPNAANGTDQQKAALKAEAMLNRAWTYFMLINYFAKPYNASTAASDPGFPIITAADVTQTSYARASVQEVYDFIISDLNFAIGNLPQNTAAAVRGSKAAAEGMLGKVYVFMGRFSEALPFLNNALAHLPASFNMSLIDYNVVLAPGGAWGYTTNSQYTYVTGPSQNNQEAMISKYLVNYNALNYSSLLLSKEAYELFGADDMRRKLFSRYPYGSTIAYTTPDVYRRIGGMIAYIGLNLPDVYLLKAECEARTNAIADAQATLETFRKKRMPAASAPVTITDRNDLTKFVIEERIREFALEGHRWFDMRRLSVDPLFSSNQYTHKLILANGTVETYPLKPERFLIRFSPKMMAANPGWTNNP